VLTAVAAHAAQGGRETAGDGGGNVTGAAAAAHGLGAGGLQNADTQHDGIHDLHNGGGNAPLLVAGLGLGTEGGTVSAGAEDVHRGVSSEENDLLFQYSDTVKLGGLCPCGTAHADASLEDELDVEADVDGVEAAVELDGINADVGPGDAGILDTDLGGVLDDLLTQIGEKDTYVLIAVPIAAGVQNTVGLHTNGPHVTALATAVSHSRAGNETIFRHDSYLLKDWENGTIPSPLPVYASFCVLTGFYRAYQKNSFPRSKSDPSVITYTVPDFLG
jgi:hypothetical protein